MIANQAPEELERFRRNAGIEFSFLVDEGARTIARYGVVNHEKEGLPHPASFVLDEKGLVVYSNVNPDYKQRPEAKELLLAIANR